MQKLKYPFLNAKKPKANAFDQYWVEPKTLGTEGIHAILDKGKKWRDDFAKTVTSHGAVLFPHTYLSKCGYQISAAVHAILDSGADQALILGVLHPMTEQLMEARSRELNGEDVTQEPSYGIFGPDLERADCIKHEFSLTLFKILFDAEVKRRGVKPPRLIERYPSLIRGEPEKVPGIRELQKIAQDSVVVATDDMCHHGVGYGVSEKDAYDMDEKGYNFARQYIEEGYKLLKKDDFRGYFSHWMNPSAIGDPTDTAIVLKYLLGNVSPQIMDLNLVDVSPLFENDIAPSWVATTLVKFKKDSLEFGNINDAVKVGAA